VDQRAYPNQLRLIGSCLIESSRLMSVLMESCSFCHQGARFVCNGCGEQLYCSRKCQKRHWKTHRRSCLFWILATTIGGSEVRVQCARTERVKVLRKKIENERHTGRNMGVVTKLSLGGILMNESQKLWTLNITPQDLVCIVEMQVSESSRPSLTDSTSSESIARGRWRLPR
jgi:hypothetical protein